jgi:hypothetical protein
VSAVQRRNVGAATVLPVAPVQQRSARSALHAARSAPPGTRTLDGVVLHADQEAGGELGAGGARIE